MAEQNRNQNSTGANPAGETGGIASTNVSGAQSGQAGAANAPATDAQPKASAGKPAATSSVPSAKRPERAVKADEPEAKADEPYPSQADLDAMREGRFHHGRRRDVTAEDPKRVYKTR